MVAVVNFKSHSLREAAALNFRDFIALKAAQEVWSSRPKNFFLSF